MAQVLLVDDDESSRLLVSSILRNAGHDVSLATSGEEALQAFLHTAVDTVVTDLHMPFGGGLELIEAVIGLSPETRIIAMSGSDGAATLSAARDLGAHATLSKPVMPSELLVAMEGPRVTAS